MSLYVTEAEVAELLTPADARNAVHASWSASRAASSRTRRVCAPSSGRRLRGDALRRPRARLRRAQDVRLAPRRHAVPRRALLDRARGARCRRRGRPARAAAHGRGVRRRRAAARPQRCGDTRRVRLRASGGFACRRAARGAACSRAGRRLRSERGPGRGVLRGAWLRAGGEAEDAGACDVVVTATTATQPVLSREWLRPGALVLAIGANDPASRELDAGVLQRADFVCTDSREQALAEAGDLIGAALEPHELQDVVTGTIAGRKRDDDIVVFKSNGLAAWDLAAAARVVELVARARCGRRRPGRHRARARPRDGRAGA